MPLPLSRTDKRRRLLSRETVTRGLIPGSTYCSPLETYSHTTNLSVLNRPAACRRSRATWLLTKRSLLSVISRSLHPAEPVRLLAAAAPARNRRQTPSAPSRSSVHEQPQ